MNPSQQSLTQAGVAQATVETELVEATEELSQAAAQLARAQSKSEEAKAKGRGAAAMNRHDDALRAVAAETDKNDEGAATP